MAKKEDSNQPLTPEQELEARVDAMMAPDRPDQPAIAQPKSNTQAPAAGTADDQDLPPLDIFTSPATAPDVPDHLLEDIENTIDEAAAEKEPGETVPPEVSLDDPTSDAAVDEIVAEEGDTVLATEDAALEENQAETEPVPEKGRHPIFWAIIFILAVAAVVAAYLLVTGGNATVPGADTIQGWFEKLQN